MGGGSFEAYLRKLLNLYLQGQLEEEAAKRKQRLAALKRKLQV